MSTTTPISSSTPIRILGCEMDRPRAKRWALIAVSMIMALGMIIAYAAGAPWLVILSFFALTLAPILSLHKVVDKQRLRIQ